MPDWDGVGTWWVTQDGRVGHADESGESTVVDLDEEIANSLSVDAEGLFVVTVEALYKLAGRRRRLPRTSGARRTTTATS